jgi:hypothetical protein
MYGQLGTVQIAAQASLGTSTVSSLRALPVVTENLKLSIDTLQEKSLYGRFAESPRYSGKRSVAGKMDFEPFPSGLGALLYAACGQVVTTSGTGIQTHKFRPLNTADWDESAALPPFSALIHRDVASAMLYSDLQANMLTLECVNGELLKGSVDWVGGQYADNAKAASSAPNEPAWSWNQVSVSYGGTALGNLRRFSVKLDNKVAAEYLFGNSVYPALFKRTGAVEVSGDMTLVFASNSLMADFLNPPEKQLVVNFFSSVSSPAALRIDIPNLRIKDYGPAITGPGMLELPISWVADYAASSGYQLEFTLVNTSPSYP